MDRLEDFSQIVTEDICWALKICFFIKKILTGSFGILFSYLLPTIVDDVNSLSDGQIIELHAKPGLKKM